MGANLCESSGDSYMEPLDVCRWKLTLQAGQISYGLLQSLTFLSPVGLVSNSIMCRHHDGSPYMRAWWYPHSQGFCTLSSIRSILHSRCHFTIFWNTLLWCRTEQATLSALILLVSVGRAVSLPQFSRVWAWRKSPEIALLPWGHSVRVSKMTGRLVVGFPRSFLTSHAGGMSLNIPGPCIIFPPIFLCSS